MKTLFNALSQGIYTIQLAYHAITPNSMSRCMAAAGVTASAGGAFLVHAAANGFASSIDPLSSFPAYAGAGAAYIISHAAELEKESNGFYAGASLGAIAYLLVCGLLPETASQLARPDIFEAFISHNPALLHR